MSAPNEIKLNDVVKNRNETVEFQMNQSLDLRWAQIFSKHDDGTFFFKNENGVLDLSCLRALHLPEEGQKEKFLPEKLFVRSYLQTALKYRLGNDKIRTVVYGSPGVGKSVFAFLAAIAVASMGSYNAVLYVRKVTGEEEKCTSAFWMTKADDQRVRIVACRQLDKDWAIVEISRAFSNTHFAGTENAINKRNTPTTNGIKIIVDGPRYEEDTGHAGSDLITSGGCPTLKQHNLGSEWQFPLNTWSFQEMAPALKAIKNCNRDVAKRVFETTGGSIRLALQCIQNSGTLDDSELINIRKWMTRIAKNHANKSTIDMTFYTTELSADPNSLDRLRSMIVREDAVNCNRINGQLFDTSMLLASPFVAGLLQSQLTLDKMLEALNFAKNSRIGSLYGWHFELWAHKISEIAIDRWQKMNKEVIEKRHLDIGGKILGHIEGEGTGKESVKFLNAVWLYWKPSIPNFANIDAAILLEDGTLLCLQFTVDSAHGFNFKTFKGNFLDQIPAEIRSEVKKIVVKFVIPSEKKEFSSVRVPHAQVSICTSVVKIEEGPTPAVHFVRKETPAVVGVPMELDNQGTQEEEKGTTEDSSMDTDGTFSIVTDYDEDLDYDFFFDETGESNLELKPNEWDMGDVVFQWMAVDPARVGDGRSPFFALPLHNLQYETNQTNTQPS